MRRVTLMHVPYVADDEDCFELTRLMLSFYFRKQYSINESRFRHSRRRSGLAVEQLESRLALANDAPFVIAMLPHDDNQVSLQMSEDVVNLDIGDFELLQGNHAIDLSTASVRAVTASNYSILLPELSEGLFELRLVAAGSDVADMDGEPLQQNASTQLTVRRRSTSWQVEHSQTVTSPTVQRIAALGDSMTYEGGGSYASVLRNMLSSYTISLQTFASAGWKAEKLYSVWQNEVRDQGFDTLIVFSGIPDLSSEGATAASTFERLRELYDDATSRGLNVICMSLSPWAQYKKWTPQRQTETLRLNNLIRQHVAEHASTMRLVDTYASLGSPNEPERLWPRYDVGDGLHIVPAGDERLARLVSTAVLDFISSEPIVQSAVIKFSRDVFGFSPDHIRLTQSNSAVPFQLVPIDGRHYRIDFAAPASRLSEFRLNLDLSQGPIVDDSNRPVGGQPDVILSVDYQTPLVSLQSDQASVSSIAVVHIQVTFSEAVTDVRLANFKLLRDRVQLTPLQGTITRLSNSTFDFALAPALTTPDGTYQLLYQPTLGIQDSAGNIASRGSILTWVKLDVAPVVINGTLKLSGTQGLDNMEVIVGPFAIRYTLNGFEQLIPRAGIERIEVQPGQSRDLVSLMVSPGADPLPVSALSNDGLDRAYLYDSSGNDLFTSNADLSSITNGAYQLTATGFVQVTAISRAGNDRATLVDSVGVDTLEGGSRLTTLKRAGGVEVNALNFPVVLAMSQNGGNDIANLYDTAGDDNVQGTMNLVTLNVPGYQISANSFSRVNVRATRGNDRVTLTGSSAAERFVGQPSSSVWSSGSLARYFYNFDQIDLSSGGGNDTAKLFGSAGNDFFEARGRVAKMTGSNFQYAVTDYKRVDAYSRAGTDSALLVGTTAVESVTGKPTISIMTGSSFVNVADGFANVTVESGGGTDLAALYDSSGNDRLIGNPSQVTLSSAAYTITAKNYVRVNVYASTGIDRAELSGSSGNDIYTGRPADSSLKGSAYLIFASGFDSVVAVGAGGNDVANFYDSSGDDRADIEQSSARMLGANFTNLAVDFARVQMFASSGQDAVEYTDSPGHDNFAGSGHSATITSSTLVATLQRFKSIRLSDRRGGNNQIVRNAINYQLSIGAGWSIITA